MPNVLSPRDLVSRPDNMYETVYAIHIVSMCMLVLTLYFHCMNRVVRKPAFCICENKDADQLRVFVFAIE